MLLSLLLVTASWQQTPAATSLHPADTDFYVHVPDLQAAARSIARSPLFETLRDEEVRAFIQGLQGGEEFDLDTSLTELLEVQIPAADRALLDAARTLSLSLDAKSELSQRDASQRDASQRDASQRDASQRDASQRDASQNGLRFQLVLEFTNAEAAQTAFQKHLAAIPGAQLLDDPAWPGAIELPAEPGLPLELWSTFLGSRVIVASANLRSAATAARLAGADPGLATRSEWVEGRKHLGAPAGEVLFEGFSTRSPLQVLAELVEQMNPGMEITIPSALAFFGGARTWRLAMQGDRFVSECFAPDAPATKSLLGVAAIDPSWAARIPTGKLFAFATTIDGPRLGALFREGLALLETSLGTSGRLAALEESLGFEVRDPFTHLGRQLTLQAAGISGIGLPETTLCLELEDEGAFRTKLAALVEKLPAAFPGFGARARAYKVRTPNRERVPFDITSFSLPPEMSITLGGMIPISVEPSMTIAEGRLYVAFSSIHLKRELKRLFAEKPEEAQPTDPWASAGIELPEGTRSAAFIDWNRQIEGLVALAKTLGPLLGSDLPFDFDSIPAGETFTRRFGPTFDYVVPRAGGLYTVHEASFGPETWLGVPAAAFVAAFRSSSALIPPPLAETASVGGAFEGGASEAAADPATARFTTEIALQQVRAGVGIYKVDRGGYPATLAALLESSDAFPNGVLATAELPSDGWGRPLLYAREDRESEVGYRVWSAGPNGVDEGGQGDDVTLP